MRVQEGEKELQRLEGFAVECFKASADMLSHGIGALWEIREDALWHYARDQDGVLFGDREKPKWENYLSYFCEHNRISRSGTFDHLRTVALWNELGRPVKQLVEEIGVKRARPIRQLVTVDGRSGRVNWPSEETLERLPPGDTPKDQINAMIDEILVQPEVPLTPSDIRKSFKIDASGQTELYYKQESEGIVCVLETQDDIWSGPVIPDRNWRKLPAEVREDLERRLKIIPYEPE
jgi:hypothetical protein